MSDGRIARGHHYERAARDGGYYAGPVGLVERLRDPMWFALQGGELLTEAADATERMTKRIDVLELLVDELRDENAVLVDALELLVDELRHENAVLAEEVLP